MDVRDETAVAYTYAWWLTGDERAAEEAVRTAVGSPAVAAAAGARRMTALLREVRCVAAPEPTMCPASEVALLHDGHGVPLDEAAGLAAVDPADARVELAHGRFEALTETVIDPFLHPERLGGLATGNPADVAHARQCDSCGHARRLLDRGRAELRDLAAVPVPEELRAPPAAPGRAGGSPGRAARAGLPATGRRLLVLTLLAVAVVAVVLLLTDGAQLGSTPVPEGGETTTVTPPALATQRTVAPADPDARAARVPERVPPRDPRREPEPETGLPSVRDPLPDPASLPPVDEDAFAVEEAGLVTAGGPRGTGATLGPGDPFRLAVRYRGAEDGMTLTGRWTVDGEPYRELRTSLVGAATAHVFGAPPPAEGWPAGTHEVFLSAQDAVVAVVAFRVG